MATSILTPLDLAQNELLHPVLHVLASAPSSPVTGQFYYDSTLGNFGFYNGSTWVYPTTGTGTVTTVSVVTANGFQGTVATATTTPAITLQTSVTSGSVIKASSNQLVAAVSGTDYAPATSGSSILKGNGSGGFSNATSGTDYAPATSGSSILKGNGSGGFNSAVSNTDYLPPASPTMSGTPTAPTAASGTNTTQVATTQFVTSAVSAAVQGLNIKPSAVAATVGTETFTVASGNVTQITGTTVDGQTPAVNDRILIKDAPASTGTGSANSTQPGNGLYIVTSNTTNLSVSRDTSMSGTNGPAGAFVFIEGGTANGDNGYVVAVPSTNAAFTYGTNNIKWQQFSGAGEITAGTGLTKAGNTLSLSIPVSIANGGTNAITASAARTSLGAPGLYNSGLTLGNGSLTSITVTHNLNNAYPLVMVYNSSSQMIVCDITATNANTVTLGFSVAPASNTISCVVVG